VSAVKPRGVLLAKKIPVIERPQVTSLSDAIRYGTAFGASTLERLMHRERTRWQRANLINFQRSLEDQLKFDTNRLFAIGHLWLAHVRNDGSVTDLGLASCRVVTDTGVQYIVDAFQNLVELENMRYHGLGTGTTAEAATQTALVTELTTQYSTSNTRPTGTLGEKSGDAKTYETTATITVSASVAATEHAILSQASNSGGVMLDRSLFTVVNLASGESLQATYQLTFPSNG
jgi:hypothetical protein